MPIREWLSRLRDWFHRDRLDAELAEELRFHRASLEQACRAAGYAEPDAATAASRRLGNVTRIREEVRDRWSWPWLDRLQQDVRLALRGLRRAPGFTATVIVTLGLGIGANAAMFGVIDQLMFRPFRYLRDPARVDRVYLRERTQGTERPLGSMPFTQYLDFRRTTSSFSQLAAFSTLTDAVGLGDDSAERPVAVVTASFFDFFDAPPALGRYFTAAEDSTPRGAPVVVLGFDFWTAAFGARPVTGEQLQVGAVNATIIGVAPEGFVGVTEGPPPAVFLPITTYAASQPNAHNYYTDYNWGWVQTMVRRKTGITRAQATADLTQADARTYLQARITDPDMAPIEEVKPAAIAGGLKLGAGPDPSLEARTAVWVAGVALIVLLIACANVANLLLGRVLRRQRELALRLALGVSRQRLAIQSLTESLILALLGCGAGLLVAGGTSETIRRLLLTNAGPGLSPLTDGRTLLVAVGAALLTGTAIGLAPALLFASGDLVSALKAGPREGGPRRTKARAVLLVSQAALSVALLVGAALFVRSLGHVIRFPVGYQADGVVLVQRKLRGASLDDAGQRALGRALLAAAEGIPGVRSAALVTSVPLMSTSATDLYVPGIDSVGRLGQFTYQAASARYFETMGTRIVRGRGFTSADRAGSAPILVPSQAMAAVLWPGQDPIGKCVRISADTMPCSRVVGVAEDIVQRSEQLGSRSRYHYYVPVDQHPTRLSYRLLVRMRGEAAASSESVRRALQPLMPGSGYITVQPFAQLLGNARRSWRLGATMFAAFGLLALLVSAVGLYGVVGYEVTQRLHELSVRMALGARSADIARIVMARGLRFAGVGIVIGAGLALLASRWLQPLLFQQSARDPVIYALVATVLLLVAVAATLAPAARAIRTDPNSALKAE